VILLSPAPVSLTFELGHLAFERISAVSLLISINLHESLPLSTSLHESLIVSIVSLPVSMNLYESLSCLCQSPLISKCLSCHKFNKPNELNKLYEPYLPPVHQ
jgi:hypothetical protein